MFLTVLQVVISTLPAQVGFTLPPQLLETASPPVIFDVVYKPAMTKLIAQVPPCITAEYVAITFRCTSFSNALPLSDILIT